MSEKSKALEFIDVQVESQEVNPTSPRSRHGNGSNTSTGDENSSNSAAAGM